MKSVIHIITTIERGGAENQLLILAREQVNSGFAVRILPLKGIPELKEDFLKLGCSVEQNYLKHSFLMQVIKLFFFLGSNKSLIHAHLPRAEILAALCKRKNKLVVTKHNTEPFFPGSAKWISRLMARYVAKRAQMTVTISQAVKDYLVKIGELELNSKISVVHYGFDENVTISSKETLKKLRTDIGVSQHETLIVTVSRLSPQKDLRTLMKAFTKFLEKYPDSKLLIIGAGPLEDNLKQFSIELNSASKIIWFGRSSQVFDFMAASDIFVLSSLYEGFGLVLLEAFSVGIPVTASRNSAIIEVMGADSDLLFETGKELDLVNKLIKIKEGNIQTIIRNQNLRLKTFSPQKMLDSMSLVYSEL